MSGFELKELFKMAKMIIVASHAESKLVYVSFSYSKVDNLIVDAIDLFLK